MIWLTEEKDELRLHFESSDIAKMNGHSKPLRPGMLGKDIVWISRWMRNCLCQRAGQLNFKRHCLSSGARLLNLQFDDFPVNEKAEISHSGGRRPEKKINVYVTNTGGQAEFMVSLFKAVMEEDTVSLLYLGGRLIYLLAA